MHNKYSRLTEIHRQHQRRRNRGGTGLPGARPGGERRVRGGARRGLEEEERRERRKEKEKKKGKKGKEKKKGKREKEEEMRKSKKQKELG
jgi:hypothetical protein